MILHPAIFALNVGSAFVSCMLIYSSWFAVKTIRNWDLSSGSDLQLDLERRTYLVSTIMSYAFLFQLFSFFLFVFTADKLAGLFVGAMCAAGTLNVNGFGYPVLLLKVLNFLIAGVWLIINFIDNKAIDYPLVKKKYAFLLIIAPCIIAESIFQYLFFSELKPNLITSCCGSLFSLGSETVTRNIASVHPLPMKAAFFTCLAGIMVSGTLFIRKDSVFTGSLFSLFAFSSFLVSSLSLVSFISLYIYQLPTHHCPFCILQQEYHYIGYVLYGLLLAGGIGAASDGFLFFFRKTGSLKEIIPSFQKKITWTTMICFGIFAVITIWYLIFSPLKLEGYWVLRVPQAVL